MTEGSSGRPAGETTRVVTDGAVRAGGSLDEPFDVEFVHRIRFTRNAFDLANDTLEAVIRTGSASPGRMAVVIDDGVADAWPDLPVAIDAYLEQRLGCPPAPALVIPGGERAKNDWAIYESVARLIHDAALCRHSHLLAIGGGAVLDVAGFAAATAHRGVRLVRLPTTTLAQGDAGIGVKNGVNAFGKKNFLGCFAVPWAVINDEVFLTTLSDRDWRCGLSEAVKVALLKDAAFFELIEANTAALRARDEDASRPVILRSAELHLEHIVTGGDPFELSAARPLDFGHWSAHKLEQITGFHLRHGEAVAVGLAIDVLYSAAIGRMDRAVADRIVRLLEALGFDLDERAIADPQLVDGLQEFREHLGGRLTITLVADVGKPFDVHEIDADRLREAIDALRSHMRSAATP